MRRRLFFAAYLCGLSAAFYVYVLLRIRPELFYQQNPRVFLLDFDFFARFVEQPGGLVDCASAFLSPLFVAGWLGALIVTSLTALICLATQRFIMTVTGSGVILVPTNIDVPPHHARRTGLTGQPKYSGHRIERQLRLRTAHVPTLQGTAPSCGTLPRDMKLPDRHHQCRP